MLGRGTVDTANPPISGLNGVSAADGLTTRYLYDNNLSDGVGFDGVAGVSALKFGTRVSGNAVFSACTPTSQLASLTDAENQTTVHTYDTLGSKLSDQYPVQASDSTVVQTGYCISTFVYDKACRVSLEQIKRVIKRSSRPDIGANGSVDVNYSCAALEDID